MLIFMWFLSGISFVILWETLVKPLWKLARKGR